MPQLVQVGRLMGAPKRSGAGAVTQQLSIQNNVASNLTNFQVKVPITWVPGMRTDFGDVRFTDANGALSYWIQTDYTAGVSATAWVKIPSLLSSATISINMLYGAGQTSTGGNGVNTFDFFDDFESGTIDPAKWTVIQDAGGRSWSFVDVWKATALAATNPGGGPQGLCADGTYFYCGNSGVDGASGTIYKVDYAGNNIANFAGPPHCNAGQFRENGNMIWWSAGDPTVRVAWEITTAGVHVRTWDFSAGLAQTNGPNGAYAANGLAYVHSASSDNLTHSIQAVQLADDGSWTLASMSPNTWAVDVATVPIPRAQAPYWKDGIFRLLIDDNTGTTAGTTNYGQVIGYTLNANGTATVTEQWKHLPATEREGLAFDGVNWFYSTHGGAINKLEISSFKLAEFVTASGSTAASAISIATFAAPNVVLGRAAMNGQYPSLGFSNKNSGTTSGNSSQFGKFALGTANLKARAMASAVVADTDLPTTTDYPEWHNYEIKRQATTADYFVDGVNRATVSSGLPSGALPVQMGITALSGTSNISLDYIAVRKFAATDPTVTLI